MLKDMRVIRNRIPVTVIGGFLGAGKTTLVNHLIRQNPYKLGVIVNEFGSLGVDGALIENLPDEDITELTAGCLCCSGRNDLIEALVKLVARPQRPEYVLIELSGLADPVPVMQTLLDPQVRALFELDGLVTVLDARNFYTTLEQNPEMALQLAYASSIVINKSDLADQELLDLVQDTSSKLAPLAKVIRTHHSEVASDQVLNQKHFSADLTEDVLETTHQHTAGVRSFVLKHDEPLDMIRWHYFLQKFILERPGHVLRVKGYLAFKDIPEEVLFQAVRDIFSAEALTDPHDNTSQLVVIGRDLDREMYQAAFRECSGDPITA
ncbi:cobalamin biosynthesis protein CobW [Deinococcus cellulosilyticus NBRC 106333 = KACC 11606]|uniref:Cobalamin biosynthesis protein CobW n=2 Tax=Deinococcus cellulosilyticus TaxID=401558 RepID=A0A511N7I9_DEIC1|nr:cobalamin biosynthesis protein CobW [Deinococcus cellulosilyticus NBRC 106333 = KACC 11606]